MCDSDLSNLSSRQLNVLAVAFAILLAATAMAVLVVVL
jgi:hypothetical protein